MPVDIDGLWQPPSDIETRDLLHGPGGTALAPDPAAAYTFVKADTSGFSGGYDVTAPVGSAARRAGALTQFLCRRELSAAGR